MSPTATYRVHHADALSIPEPDGSVHCVVTSPPYYGLRDYKVEPTDWPAFSYAPMPGVAAVDVPAMRCQLGLEPTPEAFIAHLVLVFREVRRVLREDGTCWVNIGDSHVGGGRGSIGQKSRLAGSRRNLDASRAAVEVMGRSVPAGHKKKDLLGVPWRLAFALQADGWWLRMDNIWSKPNPMPESVTDRTTRSHEHVFHLAKSADYFYDAEAIKEAASYGHEAVYDPGTGGLGGGDRKTGASTRRFGADPGKRNKRSVWNVSTRAYGGDHYATYNPDLIEPCILAGTSAAGCCAACGGPWKRLTERVGGGPSRVADRRARAFPNAPYDGGGKWESNGSVSVGTPNVRTAGWAPACACEAERIPCTVLDPFNGHATTGVAALRNGRSYVGVENNPADVAASLARLADVQPPLLASLMVAAPEEPEALGAPPSLFDTLTEEAA